MCLLTSRRIILFASCAMVAFSTSCSDITEYNEIYNAGLTILSPDDFSPVISFPGLSSASSVMLYPGMIFVATSDGIVYCYDSETRELISSSTVGYSSPSAYRNMVLSTKENSAYITGFLGNIIEVSLPDCQVVDEFSVCSTPQDLCLTNYLPGISPGYLWVIDSASRTINQVNLANNIRYLELEFPTGYTPLCLEPSYSVDTLLVGTSNGLFMTCGEGTGSATLSRLASTTGEGRIHSLACIPNDSAFVVAHGDSPSYISLLDMASSPGKPDSGYYGSVPVEGFFHFCANANDYIHCYVLSYLGDGISQLVSYHTQKHEIILQAEINGYPLDLKVGGSGMIYVLTCE